MTETSASEYSSEEESIEHNFASRDVDSEDEDAPPEATCLSSFKVKHSQDITSQEKILMDLKLKQMKELKEKRSQKHKMFNEQKNKKVRSNIYNLSNDILINNIKILIKIVLIQGS